MTKQELYLLRESYIDKLDKIIETVKAFDNSYVFIYFIDTLHLTTIKKIIHDASSFHLDFIPRHTDFDYTLDSISFTIFLKYEQTTRLGLTRRLGKSFEVTYTTDEQVIKTITDEYTRFVKFVEHEEVTSQINDINGIGAIGVFTDSLLLKEVKKCIKKGEPYYHDGSPEQIESAKQCEEDWFKVCNENIFNDKNLIESFLD